MKTWLLLIFLGMGLLTACGKKGGLRLPEGSTYPQSYPRSSNVAR